MIPLMTRECRGREQRQHYIRLDPVAAQHEIKYSVQLWAMTSGILFDTFNLRDLAKGSLPLS